LQRFITKVKQLKPDGDDTDKRTMAFLTYAKQHIVDGKFTWKQILLAGIFGTIIGAGYGNGMVPVLSGGLRGLGPTYFKYIYDNNTGAIISTVYITVTRGIDSMSRNIKTIGNLAGPSTAEFSVAHTKYKIWKIPVDSRKIVIGAVCGSSAAASLLAFWYIWDGEKWNIANVPSLRAGSIGYVAGFGPCLFADAFLLYTRSVIPWMDEIFNQRAIRRTFSDRLSPEYVLRQQELKRFKELERFFKFVPDEDIHGLYEDVLVNGFKITKNGTHMPEIIKGADFLRVLKVLRKTHESYRIPEDVKETWKNIVSKTASWVIPTAATVGRSLVFYFIMDSLFESIGMPSGFGRGLISWIFGGGLASLFLGKVEKDAVEDGVYDLLRGQEREGDPSHSCVRSGFRKVGKGNNYFQGAQDTLPYIFAGTVATQGWPLALQIPVLLFFGIADLFNNTMGYHESYGDVFYTGESLASHAYTSASYKRRKLIRLVRRYSGAYETMAPDVMMKINALLSGEENNELLNDF